VKNTEITAATVTATAATPFPDRLGGGESLSPTPLWPFSCPRAYALQTYRTSLKNAAVPTEMVDMLPVANVTWSYLREDHPLDGSLVKAIVTDEFGQMGATV
jgi:hypothetical protein